MRGAFHAGLLLVSLTLGCAQELFAEMRVERICVARVGETVPGVPLSVDQVSWQGAFDLGSELPEDAVTGTVELLEFSVTSDQTDLSGITGIRVSVIDADGGARTVAEYAPAQPIPVPTYTLATTVDSGVDVFSYLSDQSLRYRMDFTGAPPTEDWTAEFEVCMYANVRVDALEL